MLAFIVICLSVFIIALFVHFRIRERSDTNLLDHFDNYKSSDFDAEAYMQKLYNPEEFRRDALRGQQKSSQRPVVDIFKNLPQQDPEQPPTLMRDSAGRLVKQLTKGNPALEQAFRELQSEFQKTKQR